MNNGNVSQAVRAAFARRIKAEKDKGANQGKLNILNTSLERLTQPRVLGVLAQNLNDFDFVNSRKYKNIYTPDKVAAIAQAMANGTLESVDIRTAHILATVVSLADAGYNSNRALLKYAACSDMTNSALDNDERKRHVVACKKSTTSVEAAVSTAIQAMKLLGIITEVTKDDYRFIENTGIRAAVSSILKESV